MNKPAPNHVLRLAFQFTQLAGGPKLKVSPFDIAMDYIKNAGILKNSDGNSKNVFKQNFEILCDWIKKNHPGCPAKKKKPAQKKAEAKPSAATRRLQKQTLILQKTEKPIRKTTVLGVESFISHSSIDPRSDAFLSSFEWRATRMMALKKHGAICQCCGASPKSGAVIHVDHVKPRKEFPELALDVENLQILCHECNHGKGNWDKTDWRPARVQAEIQPWD